MIMMKNKEALKREVERKWTLEFDPDPIRAIRVKVLNPEVALVWVERRVVVHDLEPSFGLHVSIQEDGSILVDYDRPMTRDEFETGEWEA